MNNKIPNKCCSDCEDLRTRDITHNCHCHKSGLIDWKDLPNLSSLLGTQITGVYYMRDPKTGQVKGIKIMTEHNMTLSVNLDGKELNIEYAGSV